MNDTRMITAAERAIRRAQTSEWPAISTSVSVSAPFSCAIRLSLGATQSQLIRKPPTVAGKSHTALKPQRYAAPLTPSSVQADDELAEALSAARPGPSLRPAR